MLAAEDEGAHRRVMSSALKLPLQRMTVVEFLDWDSGDTSGALWQLRDGEPEMMAPASDRHGSIQAQLTYLLIAHLGARGGPCRVVVAPGVVPARRSEENCLVPDLGVTCVPPNGARLMHEPVILIEILSPTNVSKARANVRDYMTIATVAEILVLRSTSVVAEVLRRQADGSWPEQPELVTGDGVLGLDSIGFAEPLRSAYRMTNLA
jgi:Uma2 family endonuclease